MLAKLGRPLEFDRDKAIDQAVVAFWKHGYDATSISLLREVMGGISSASFYGAFHSKEALFKVIIDRYQETLGKTLAPLTDPSLPPRQAVEKALLRSARMQTDTKHPLGCLVALSLFDDSSERKALAKHVARLRAGNRAAFRALVERAIQDGHLKRSLKTVALMAAIDTFFLGMPVQARDGIRFAELKRAIMGIMTLWDLLSATSKS